MMYIYYHKIKVHLLVVFTLCKSD